MVRTKPELGQNCQRRESYKSFKKFCLRENIEIEAFCSSQLLTTLEEVGQGSTNLPTIHRCTQGRGKGKYMIPTSKFQNTC
jgi:hypothetical protein